LRHEAASERLEIEGAGPVREVAPFEISQPLGLSLIRARYDARALHWISTSPHSASSPATRTAR
jgi:hypothetical protein